MIFTSHFVTFITLDYVATLESQDEELENLRVKHLDTCKRVLRELDNVSISENENMRSDEMKNAIQSVKRRLCSLQEQFETDVSSSKTRLHGEGHARMVVSEMRSNQLFDSLNEKMLERSTPLSRKSRSPVLSRSAIGSQSRLHHIDSTEGLMLHIKNLSRQVEERIEEMKEQIRLLDHHVTKSRAEDDSRVTQLTARMQQRLDTVEQFIDPEHNAFLINTLKSLQQRVTQLESQHRPAYGSALESNGYTQILERLDKCEKSVEAQNQEMSAMSQTVSALANKVTQTVTTMQNKLSEFMLGSEDVKINGEGRVSGVESILESIDDLQNKLQQHDDSLQAIEVNRHLDYSRLDGRIVELSKRMHNLEESVLQEHDTTIRALEAILSGVSVESNGKQ